MIPRRTPIMGNGPGEKPLFAGLESPAIAHSERVANAGVVTFDVPERDFPRNRSPARWKFVSRPERKIWAPGEVARFQRRPAAHRFSPKQLHSQLAAAHQIGVHDPAVPLSRRSADAMDLVGDILQAPGDQDLVR